VSTTELGIKMKRIMKMKHKADSIPLSPGRGGFRG
jgi:hypothetical protein